MKRRWFLVVGVPLGAIAGWGFASLGLSNIAYNYPFLVGVMVTLSLVAIALLLVYGLNRNTFVKRVFSRGSSDEPAGTIPSLITAVGLLFAIGVLIAAFSVSRMNTNFGREIKKKDDLIAEQTAQIKNLQAQNLMSAMNELLEELEEEVQQTPERIVSDQMVARIAALSFSMKPYKSLEGDSVSEKVYSPERGQLLIALARMNIDSSSFENIKAQSDFSGADLRRSDFAGMDLKGLKAKRAIFDEAKLEGTNFSKADLEASSFWAAYMNHAVFDSANLKWCNLSWADMNFASMKHCDFFGSDFASAKLQEADLSYASLKRADLEGANMAKIKFVGAFLRNTGMRKANLTGADFTNSVMTESVYTGADLTGVNITNAVLNRDAWFEKMTDWNVGGIEEIKLKYDKVEDTSGRAKWMFVRK